MCDRTLSRVATSTIQQVFLRFLRILRLPHCPSCTSSCPVKWTPLFIYWHLQACKAAGQNPSPVGPPPCLLGKNTRTTSKTFLRPKWRRTSRSVCLFTVTTLLNQACRLMPLWIMGNTCGNIIQKNLKQSVHPGVSMGLALYRGEPVNQTQQLTSPTTANAAKAASAPNMAARVL